MKRNRGCSGAAVMLVTLVIVLLSGMMVLHVTEIVPGQVKEPSAKQAVKAFAQEQGLSVTEWPDSLIAMLDANPETRDFVLHYPLKKDAEPMIDLQDCVGTDEVPLLMQWDERWGYKPYAGECFGLSGCGPTCLSMVCLYVLEDERYDPLYIARFAEDNGYASDGQGSQWTLISEGGEMLGLDVTEIPLDEARIRDNLAVGNPIICILGEGDFTTSGHFIVLTAYDDGVVRVNDPNSRARSEKEWALESIRSQIRNIWVCRKGN